MRYGLIYKATNKQNGKSYIGQTVGSLESRKGGHLNCKAPTHFEKYLQAMPEAFEWTIVESKVPVVNLNEKEKYYIKHFDTFMEGYNRRRGGSTLHEGPKIVKIDKEAEERFFVRLRNAYLERKEEPYTGTYMTSAGDILKHY